MGSGKSSVCKALARSLEWRAVDMDSLIEERSGHAVSGIFKHFGEEEFRKLETSVLYHLKDEEQVVIATGGGAPCFNDNIESMLSAGSVFYLKVDVDHLIERIFNDSSVRPIVHEKSKVELRAFIENHLNEREPYYRSAHYVIDANQGIDKIVEEIKPHLDI